MENLVLVPTRFQLRELLTKKGISQSDLARDAGVSFATINRLCTNTTGQVSLETLDKIAAALNVKPGALITNDPPIIEIDGAQWSVAVSDLSPPKRANSRAVEVVFRRVDTGEERRASATLHGADNRDPLPDSRLRGLFDGAR